MAVSLTLNGKPTTLDVDPNMPLLWAIREVAALTVTNPPSSIPQSRPPTLHLPPPAPPPRLRGPRPTRRRLLVGPAAVPAGLTLGFHWAGSSRAAAAAGDVLAPNAFVRVAPDNTVTVIIKHLEMGQGTYTGLATIVAEELDADWSQVRAETAPADATRYNNLLFGEMQGTRA